MENSTVAVLLAGGKSGRMGVAKGLLKYNKTFWVLEQINRLSEANINKVYVGLGHDFEHYFWAVDWFEKAVKEIVNFRGIDVQVVINSKPELGSFSTLQAVLNSVPTGSDVLICPVDIPIPNKKTLEKIIYSNYEVVIPMFQNQHGHPIVINDDFKNRLIDLAIEDENSRLDIQIKKLTTNQILVVEVNDSSILKNLNTPSEWKQFLSTK